MKSCALALCLLWRHALGAAVAPFVPKLTWWQVSHDITIDVKVSCEPGTLVSRLGDALPPEDGNVGDMGVRDDGYDDVLGMECTERSTGRAARLAFVLREPLLQPTRGEPCKAVGGKVRCNLSKPSDHSHAFDRLAFDPDALRGVASIDHEKWTDLSRDEEADPPPDVDFDASTPGWLDAAGLAQAEAENEVVVLDVSYPWCSQCESKRAAFLRASAALSKPGAVRFAAVDALEQRSLRRRLKASCHWDCKHVVLQRGEEPEYVDARGDWEAEFVLRELESFTRPPVAHVASADAWKAARARGEISLVGVFDEAGPGGTCGKSAACRKFHATARRERTRWNFSVTSADAAEKWLKPSSTRGLHLFREVRGKHDGSHVFMPIVDVPSANLTRWLRVSSLDDVMVYTYEKREAAEALGLAIIHIFSDSAGMPPGTRLREALWELGEVLRGKASLFLLHRSTSSFMEEDFGFNGRHEGGDTGGEGSGPTVGIAPSFDYDAPHYGYRGPLKFQPMYEWVMRYFDGDLEPAVKSRPPPTEPWAPGAVRLVVGNTLKHEVLQSDADVLLCLHAPYNFEALNKTLSRAAKLLVPLGPAVRVATFNTMYNSFVPDALPGIERYHNHPVLLFYRGVGKKRVRRTLREGIVKQPTSLKDVLAFLKKHSPTVRDGWAEVKGELDQANALTLGEKARAKADADAEAASLKAAAAAAEDVDLLGDGAVLKKLLRPPLWRLSNGSDAPASAEDMAALPTPKKGSHVRVHYTGRLAEVDEASGARRELEGAVFDTSRKGTTTLLTRNPTSAEGGYEFELGGGPSPKAGVPKGWHVAVAAMRAGERALLRLAPAYAFGDDGFDNGHPPLIPPNATVEYDLELLSWEPPFTSGRESAPPKDHELHDEWHEHAKAARHGKLTHDEL